MAPPPHVLAPSTTPAPPLTAGWPAPPTAACSQYLYHQHYAAPHTVAPSAARTPLAPLLSPAASGGDDLDALLDRMVVMRTGLMSSARRPHTRS